MRVLATSLGGLLQASKNMKSIDEPSWGISICLLIDVCWILKTFTGLWTPATTTKAHVMQDTYLLGCLELPIIAYNHMSLCLQYKHLACFQWPLFKIIQRLWWRFFILWRQINSTTVSGCTVAFLQAWDALTFQNRLAKTSRTGPVLKIHEFLVEWICPKANSFPTELLLPIQSPWIIS